MLVIDNVLFTELWIRVNNLKIHLITGGAGDNMVLLHGWPGFWIDWKKVLPSLSQDFRVIVPDLRGFGFSDKPYSPSEYTLEHYSKDLEALLDSLNVDEAIIVGFDVGSTVASYFASNNQERVKALVLLNPSYPGLGKRRLEEKYAPENWYQYFHLLDMAEKLVGYNRDTVRIYLSHFFKHWAFKKDAFNDYDIEEYVDVFYSQGVRGGFNWYRARIKTRYGNWLPRKILSPTLVLWSDNDPIFPLEWSSGVKDYFPNSTLCIIRNCGHFIPMEAPDEVVRYIRDFLVKSSSTSQTW